ncbi:polysaccharide biosynthesis/export family protein [Belliella sp. DSM 111904]|uniref:Polysaccharide biosynthesis/export family protein n=1 Tax=Belliella filtrata TaxID=2923435 RepID=A0ABS9V3S1_9BACT|nr:polysaccharide biosynthesis/export family protein [Belliella filtrata]MCH7410835.1 polysaccharide biosynthesis/export family protein [Belliella filtrata]
MRVSIFKLLVIMLVASSCAKRNLTYFSDIESNSDYSIQIDEFSEVKIKPYDRLRIEVTSPSVESNLMFNSGYIQEHEELENGAETRPNPGNNNVYLVNSKGQIEFPILGAISLTGLTIEEAKEEMKFRLKSHVKEPSVNMTIANFRVTVIGEVNRPSNFLISSERINIFEAIGLAGDLTPYGKRENVLVMRDEGGKRNVYRVNLNKKDVLASPYYYLEQNDIVYIEPDPRKLKDTNNNTTLITVITVASSILVAVIFNYQNLFN